jgi:sulfatase maturation enzyme AslB (radical SAM superfamily)
MRTRSFPKENYKAVYINGKTMRFLHDNTKPMKELKYPEFYDIKITNMCNGGCPYCYQNSTPDAEFTMDMVVKIKNYFEPMTMNERPFQVAIGGGEPTLHPYFMEILRTFKTLGIVPNYTTNGMCITPEIVAATKAYCGGVAITCHEHLHEYWKHAHSMFTQMGVKTNFHIVISDRKSIDNFLQIYNVYKGDVEYFVLLPYIVKGRAKPMKIEYDYLFEQLDKLDDISDVAFGARFYKHKKKLQCLGVSLYEPEIMSKYLDMVEMKMYKSSFDSKPIKKIGQRKQK